MAEIIKEGSLKKSICKECGCEFTYKQGELETDYPSFQNGFSWIKKYVWCPCCENKAIIEIQYL